jgi:hypothetical protein
MRPLFVRQIFGPGPVPRKFDGFPKEMALRPSQIRASAAETTLMVPDAFASQKDYAHLKMPVVIVAGKEDRLTASYPWRWPHGASNRNDRCNGGHRRSYGRKLRKAASLSRSSDSCGRLDFLTILCETVSFPTVQPR